MGTCEVQTIMVLAWQHAPLIAVLAACSLPLVVPAMPQDTAGVHQAQRQLLQDSLEDDDTLASATLVSLQGNAAIMVRCW